MKVVVMAVLIFVSIMAVALMDRIKQRYSVDILYSIYCTAIIIALMSYFWL